jgi:hypothetical protein
VNPNKIASVSRGSWVSVLENLWSNPPGTATRRTALLKLSSLFERSLSGQRNHIVLRAGTAAYANGADYLAVNNERIASP